MGLQQFERRLERLVDGVFARTFRSGLQPIEVGRRLTREMDLKRQMSVRGLVAPNAFVVVLSPTDAERFSGFMDTFIHELGEAAKTHAANEEYQLLGPVSVRVEVDPDLATGTFDLFAEIAPAKPPRESSGPTVSLVLPDGRRIPIGPIPVTIGRLPGVTILLADPSVSRRHAEVRLANGVPTITDLGSTNGTRVNGLPVTQHVLRSGDRISIGATELVVEIA
jgi:hypothetical protein